MKKLVKIFALFLLSVFCVSCKQNQTEGKKIIVNSEKKDLVSSHGPEKITRNIIQDRKGNIWMAAFDGIYRYEGKFFTNITSKVSSARFFSILEDRKGNLWFGSIGSGVYYYDGKSFENFTTSEGLLNNEVTSIYEDKKGNIWFGVSGGASCYDGKSFRNYIIDENGINEDRIGKTFPNRQSYKYTVNSIIEDRKGNFWFATGGNTFVYDGKTATIFTHNSKPFSNVRSIIEDKKGNIWLGGPDGLWRYNGSTFTNFTKRLVGCIIEDKKGNIWTGSGKDGISLDWTLSKYDAEFLSNKKPIVTEIAKLKMIFGILEANDSSIWIAAFEGAFRYDGKTITDFKSKKQQTD
jgi:ligand-binding sensor domain-containing protein